MELKLKDTVTSLELLEQINFFRKKERELEEKDNRLLKNINHDSLLKIIRDEFEEEISLGELNESNYKSRGKEYPMFILNFNQGKQILARESKTVRKAVFVYIEKLEKELELLKIEINTKILKEKINLQNEKWLELRNETKEVRKETTDVIQEFAEYAKSQGSKSFDMYYKHYTNATYTALNLMQLKKPKLRNTLEFRELIDLSRAETLCRIKIKEYMQQGIFYKEIYKLVKKDLENFAKVVMIGVD